MLELFAPFKNQSKLAHLGLVIAGVGAFLVGTYATAFFLYDGTSTFLAPGNGAVTARRVSLMVGATCCWLVFAVGFLRAIGGPALNYAWYPLSILVIGTSVGYPLLFGPRPEAVYTEAFSVYSPRGIWDSLVLFLPGAILSTAVFLIAAFIGFDSNDARRAWMERHLAESFLETYFEGYEDGEWIDRTDERRW